MVKAIAQRIRTYESTFPMFDFISFTHQMCLSVYNGPRTLLEAEDSMVHIQGGAAVNAESTWMYRVSCLGKVPGGVRAFLRSTT